MAPGAAPGAAGMPADVRAVIRYDAQVMGMFVGEVEARLSEVKVDKRGRRTRTLTVSARGSKTFDRFLKVRATLESTVDATTLQPVASRYKALRGDKEWSALFRFRHHRVRIDTLYKKRRWRRWRWVEGAVQDPLSWMVSIMAQPPKKGERRNMAVVTRRKYLTMTLSGRGQRRVHTRAGKFDCVETFAEFERWYPAGQLAHAKGPTARKKKTMTARVFWEQGGLHLPLRMEMKLSKIGAVRLDAVSRSVERVPKRSQLLKSAHDRLATDARQPR